MKRSNAEVPHLKWLGLPQVLPFVRPFRALVVKMLVLYGIVSCIEAAMPLFQNYAIRHFIGENTLDTLPLFAGLYLCALAVQSLLAGLSCYCSARLEVEVIQVVRQALFDHMQTLSFSYFNQNSVGYIHSRIISDPNRIGLIASWMLLDVVADLIYICGIFAVMFALCPPLALLLLCVVPAEAAAAWFFQGRLAQENRVVREQNSRITGNFNEGITGAQTIRALCAQGRMQRDFTEDTALMYRASVRAGRYKAMFQGAVVFCSGLALAFVLWRGGMLTQQGLLLVGSLSVFISYTTGMGSYVQELVGAVANVIGAQACIERITNLLNTVPDVKDTPEVIARYGDAFAPKRENWEPLDGSVEFRDVTFRYPDGEENVLEHFNLTVPQGTTVAIAGETGAGKSTLVNLVCRFYEPTEGAVLIDGRDARARSLLWLHSHIGYVLQTPHLFSGTVRENLLYGCPSAAEDEIWAALRRVHADGLVSRMEHGLDTQVGEGGNLLSTGEKQLLSFARALLADPRILILDEATASVDTLTEQAIQSALREVMRGRTCFVIAHRLSTIRSADVILVMKNGRIVEQGTHESLMAAGGYYNRLYTRRFVRQSSDDALAGGKDTVS